MSDPHDDTGGYRGPAVITVGDRPGQVDVHLYGWFDPISGRHVWRGRLRELAVAFPPDTDLRAGTTLTIEVPGAEDIATARISEVDLWGSHMVDGTSPPPYATLSDDELEDDTE